MIIDSIVMRRRVQALARDHGLDVRYADGCPHTDGKTITLNEPQWDWKEEDMLRFERSAYHEIGHCVPENRAAFQLIKDKGIHMESRIGMALNALEDLRQEDNQYGYYRGRDSVMGRGVHLNTQDLLRQNVFKKTEADGQGIEFVQKLYGYMKHVAGTTYPEVSGDLELIKPEMSAAVRADVDKLVAHDKEINPLGDTPEGTYEKAKRILTILGYDADKEEQDAKSKAKAEEQLSEAAKELAKQMAEHIHTDETVERLSGQGRGSNESIEDEYGPPGKGRGDGSGKYTPTDWDRMKITDIEADGLGRDPRYSIVEMVEKGMFLGTKVRQLLQAYTQSYYQHGLKRGRIGKNIHRVTMSGTGDNQRKIFKKKQQNFKLDTAVTLLIDCSGSMHGDEYEAAAASAAIMSHVLTQLRIPHEILGFTISGRSLQHYIFKAFNKNLSVDQVTRNLSASLAMNSNLDGESIMWAAQRLLAQKNERKLLIVLSDGAPAATGGGAIECTHMATAELQARRDLELYGIGIMSDAVKQFYKHCEVIHDTDELEGAILKVIQTKLFV